MRFLSGFIIGGIAGVYVCQNYKVSRKYRFTFKVPDIRGYINDMVKKIQDEEKQRRKE